MYSIHLNKLSFFAHHGLHDEEAITGTNFEIDATLSFDAAENITSIQQTINYADVYEVIRKHMEHPVALLEMLAQNMAHDIQAMDSRVNRIEISIYKLHPPISNFTGNVGVTYSKVF